MNTNVLLRMNNLLHSIFLKYFKIDSTEDAIYTFAS